MTAKQAQALKVGDPVEWTPSEDGGGVVVGVGFRSLGINWDDPKQPNPCWIHVNDCKHLRRGSS